MTVLYQRRPTRRGFDKLSENRTYKTVCPKCGGRLKASSTRESIRRLKCETCGHTDKEAR